MKKILFGLSLFFIGTIFAAPYEVRVKTIAPNVIPQNAVRVPILEITIDTKDEDLSISSLDIERKGLSSNSNFSRVWAETGSFRRTLKSRFGVDSIAHLRFASPLFIPKNSQEKLYILTNISSGFSIGSTFSFALNKVNESGQIPSRFTLGTNENKSFINTNDIFSSKIPVKIVPQKIEIRAPRIMCKNRKCWWVKN